MREERCLRKEGNYRKGGGIMRLSYIIAAENIPSVPHTYIFVYMTPHTLPHT